MFSPSLLYDASSNQRTAIAFHALAMCHVCKHVLDGIPGGMAATLQMQSITPHDTGDTDVPRYLLCKDAYGYQVYLSPALSWHDQWSDIMQSGFGAWPDFSATGFNALQRVATAVYNDLITRVTLTDDLFLSAHGPYSGAINIICKKLLVHGNRVKQIYKSSHPRCFIDAVWNAIDALGVQNINVRRTFDETTECPPTLLSFDNWGRGIINFVQGENAVLPDLSRYGLAHWVGEWNNYNTPESGWPNTNALLNIGQPLHWHDTVTANNTWQEGTTEKYIFDMWNSLRRGFYTRLNDWRIILNSSYSGSMLGVLRDIRNLGL